MLYAVPTFGWQQSADNGTLTSTRRGGGVRVYLGRSWWSSGEGELLGVVLGSSVPNRRDAAVSLLYVLGSGSGLDLARATLAARDELPQQRRRLQNGPAGGAREPARHGRWLRSPVGSRIASSGTPTWSWTRPRRTSPSCVWLWCAISPTRCSSATSSIPGPWLDLRASPVVLADLVQTVPNRAVTLTRDPDAAGVYNVAVSGVTYRAQRSVFNNVTLVDKPGRGPTSAPPHRR